jgi:hypothetical protein
MTDHNVSHLWFWSAISYYQYILVYNDWLKLQNGWYFCQPFLSWWSSPRWWIALPYIYVLIIYYIPGYGIYYIPDFQCGLLLFQDRVRFFNIISLHCVDRGGTKEAGRRSLVATLISARCWCDRWPLLLWSGPLVSDLN